MNVVFKLLSILQPIVVSKHHIHVQGTDHKLTVFVRLQVIK